MAVREAVRVARLFAVAVGLVLAAAPVAAQIAAKSDASAEQVEWQRLVDAAREAGNRGDAAEALRLAEQALALARAELDPENPAVIVSLIDVGAYLRQLGRAAEAEAPLEQAFEIADRRAGMDNPITQSAANSLAILRANQARYAEAAALHERVLESRERTLGADHPETLVTMNNLALVYGNQQRNAEVSRLIGRALPAAEARLGPDHVLVSTLLNTAAMNLESTGRYAEAEPYFQRAYAIRERALGADHPSTLQLLNNVATVLGRLGRLAEAEPLYLRGIAANEARLGRDHPETLTLLTNLAGLYDRQARLDESVALNERVLATRERTLGPGHPGTLDAVNALGALMGRMRRLDESERLLARAWEGRRTALGPGHLDTLSSLNNLATLRMSRGQLAEAERLYREGLETAERSLGPDHPDTARLATNLAGLYRRQQRFAEADPLYRRALDTRLRVLGPNHLETARTAANLALSRLYDPAGAAAALEPARQAVGILRARRAAAASDRFAEAQADREQLGSIQVSLMLAEAAWFARTEDQSGDPAEAFAALQEAMAGGTDAAVARMAVRRVADAAGPGLGDLAREREALAEQWDANARDLSVALGADGPEAEALAARVRTEGHSIEARMRDLDARLRRDFPQYFALVRPEPIDLTTAQALLAPDEAVLMVAASPLGTQIMAVTRDGLTWRRSSWAKARVDAAVRRLLWDVGATVEASEEEQAAWADAGEGYPFDRTTAHALHQEIVAPVAEALRGKRHLFVAAAGSLSSLPFGLLVTEPPQGSDSDPAALRATSWLADAHALIQIPSLQSLEFLRRFGGDRPSGGGPHGFIGFGDPALAGAGEQRGGARGRRAGLRSGAPLGDLRHLRNLARLPGTAEELRNMRAALGAPADSLYLADRATERNLRTIDLGGARILALATHGLLAGELSGIVEPGLVLTPPASPSAEDDGYLAASEIAALRLDADWVILSACNTAAGDGSEGAPGLSGLARAFFYAGGRTLLASHWPVRDDVSARLTVRTIEIQRGDPALSRAEAFQRAMREIRGDAGHDAAGETWAHPNAWAPFTLIGDGAQ